MFPIPGLLISADVWAEIANENSNEDDSSSAKAIQDALNSYATSPITNTPKDDITEEDNKHSPTIMKVQNAEASPISVPTQLPPPSHPSPPPPPPTHSSTPSAPSAPSTTSSPSSSLRAQISSLTSQLHSLESRNASLSSHLEEYRSIFPFASSSSYHYKENESSYRISHLDNQLKQNALQLQQLTMRMKYLHDENDLLKEENDILREEKSTWETERNEWANHVAATHHQAEEVRQAYEEMREEAAEWRRKCEDVSVESEWRETKFRQLVMSLREEVKCAKERNAEMAEHHAGETMRIGRELMQQAEEVKKETTEMVKGLLSKVGETMKRGMGTAAAERKAKEKEREEEENIRRAEKEREDREERERLRALEDARSLIKELKKKSPPNIVAPKQMADEANDVDEEYIEKKKTKRSNKLKGSPNAKTMSPARTSAVDLTLQLSPIAVEHVPHHAPSQPQPQPSSQPLFQIDTKKIVEVARQDNVAPFGETTADAIADNMKDLHIQEETNRGNAGEWKKRKLMGMKNAARERREDDAEEVAEESMKEKENPPTNLNSSLFGKAPLAKPLSLGLLSHSTSLTNLNANGNAASAVLPQYKPVAVAAKSVGGPSAFSMGIPRPINASGGLISKGLLPVGAAPKNLFMQFLANNKAPKLKINNEKK